MLNHVEFVLNLLINLIILKNNLKLKKKIYTYIMIIKNN